MTKRDIIIFVFKWEKTLIGYWLFICALSVLIVYALPQQYEAVAKILIESNRAPVMRADMAFGVDQLNVINSVVAIIRSKPVFSATADSVEAIMKAKPAEIEEEKPPNILAELFDRLGQWSLDVGLRNEASPRERLIQSLESGIKVEPQASSSVISISYKSDDPEMAATIVNTVNKNYINHHLKIFTTAGTSEVYRLQLARIEKDLEKSRGELNDYKRKKSLSALDETKHAQVLQRAQLTTELKNLETGLAELKTRFGKGHTKVVLAEERLQSTKQALDQISDKLQTLELEEDVIRNMEIEIKSMELSMQSYRKLFQDEQMVNLANPDVVNVLVIEDAVPPTTPVHSRLFYIFLSAVGGLLMSFAIAIIKEYFDHRVTDPRVASQILRVPTLGSIEKA